MERKDEILNDKIYQTAFDAWQTEKPKYAGTYDSQLADLYQQYATRPDFKYDVKDDPLYQGYKDQYVQQGKLAMKDTMGQAAALTGGYGNTYGQSVGQQAYEAYLQKLGEVVPTLYESAYGKYKDKGDDLLKQYGMIGQLRDTEYGQYRDLLNDWENGQEFIRQVEKETYDRRIAEEQTAESRKQQSYANLYAMIKASGYYPSDAELEAAGMSREAANAIAAEYNRLVSLDERQMALKEMSALGSGGGGGGGGGRGGGGGGYSDPYADGGGNIYYEARDYATEYGSGSAMNDLSSLWTSGAISRDQYALGTAGVASAGIRDYTNTLNQLAAQKSANTLTPIASQKSKEKKKK